MLVKPDRCGWASGLLQFVGLLLQSILMSPYHPRHERSEAMSSTAFLPAAARLRAAMLRFFAPLVLALGSAWIAFGQDGQRPNVLWFVIDDMSAHLSCYGETLIETPHTDRLAREGTRFTSAYVTAPVCSPSRSAMITGCYQTTIGTHHHRSGRGEIKIELPEGVEPVPAFFQRAGYHTCIGSGLPGLDHRGLPQPENLPRRRLFGKTDYNFEWEASLYDSHDWADRQPGQPFFMQVQLHGGKLREGAPETRKAFRKRVAAEFAPPTDPQAVELPPYYPRDPVLLEDWAAYLDSVRVTDWHVGQVLARLEDEGLLENTFIIFMSDHGISHARGKQFLTDEGAHIPFILRGPGVPAGVVRDDLVEHIDMAPTSLAAVGLPVPEWMQGRNLLATEAEPRRYAFAARDRCDETVDRLRSLRDQRFLYIRNGFPQRPHLQPNAYKDAKPILIALRAQHAAGTLPELSERLLFSPTRPEEELYDYREDPHQIRNLAGEPAFADILARMRDRLDQVLAETGDPGPESEAMYDSEMAEYRKRENPAREANIRLMKQWAAQGK